MGENLFDSFDAIAVQGNGDVHWAARAPYRPEAGFDLMLVPRVPDWWDHEAPRQALAQIEAEPWVDSIDQSGDAVRLRLDDGWVADAGAALEAGEGRSPTTTLPPASASPSTSGARTRPRRCTSATCATSRSATRSAPRWPRAAAGSSTAA